MNHINLQAKYFAFNFFGGEFFINSKNTPLEEMLKTASKKLGTSSENLKKAAASGKVENLLKSLGGEQSKKIQNILSDKEATKKILSSPKAKELLKKFLGDK